MLLCGLQYMSLFYGAVKYEGVNENIETHQKLTMFRQ